MALTARYCAIPVLLVFVGGVPHKAAGQRIPGPPPTPAECDSAVAALQSGNRDVMAWARLGECSAAGARALGAALLGARGERDEDYLRWLYGPASVNRDPAILTAAAEVAADKSATAPARITAMLVLVAQFRTGLEPSLRLWAEDLFGTPIGSSCPLLPTSPSGYLSRQPLQADSARLVGGALDRVRKDPTDNQHVRNWASCARGVLSDIIPITVDPFLIELTYVCENRFRVRNGGDEWIQVVYEVSPRDRGGLTVGPGASVVFTTIERGIVHLTYMEHEVAAIANQGTRCP